VCEDCHVELDHQSKSSSSTMSATKSSSGMPSSSS
jgi:hypothetical protein